MGFKHLEPVRCPYLSRSRDGGTTSLYNQTGAGNTSGRGGRVDEGGCLENSYSAWGRRFESCPLRHRFASRSNEVI